MSGQVCQVCLTVDGENCEVPGHTACWKVINDRFDAVEAEQQSKRATVYVYKSSIQQGSKYKDRDTGFIGVAGDILFRRGGGVKVKLRALISGTPVEHDFLADTLEPCEDNGLPTGFTERNAQP
jgi:hypothetical protein